jgi:hypothetical protein
VTDPTHSLKVYNRAGDVVAHTLVDADVYERFKDSRPYLAQGYVRLRLKDEQRTDQFHRIVLGCAPRSGRALVVDHVNGDPLDNRRCNRGPPEAHCRLVR